MDHFGFGNALQGAANTVIQQSRRTGRTTSLVESLRDGDRVVCLNDQQAREMRRLCQHRDLKIDVIVIHPDVAGNIFERPTSEGRTLFDHCWVEQYYLNALEGARERIDHMQRETSGYGTAHIETREAAKAFYGGLTKMTFFTPPKGAR